MAICILLNFFFFNFHVNVATHVYNFLFFHKAEETCGNLPRVEYERVLFFRFILKWLSFCIKLFCVLHFIVCGLSSKFWHAIANYFQTNDLFSCTFRCNHTYKHIHTCRYIHMHFMTVFVSCYFIGSRMDTYLCKIYVCTYIRVYTYVEMYLMYIFIAPQILFLPQRIFTHCILVLFSLSENLELSLVFCAHCFGISFSIINFVLCCCII
ncbi:unnamed protein product [Ceratitis capitata]|uniref:(Mediterranean fruit fly) hypothetical protein n=1 Tax=Ceratitis capitata TaxID=7213 RepID=A0A811V5Y6_CERCA|nr:unnamed protein product [Ceratitis capitata]